MNDPSWPDIVPAGLRQFKARGELSAGSTRGWLFETATFVSQFHNSILKERHDNPSCIQSCSSFKLHVLSSSH